MTTFTTEKRSDAAPLRAVDLDAGPQKAVTDTSPSRLGARAWAEGYPIPTLEGAGYLEIGRDPRESLLAHAFAFPKTCFTAASTSNDARLGALCEKFDVPNVTSGSLNLNGFESSGLETYDFISAADVFSTANTAERMALLVLTKRHLSDRGVACIGVDVSPGWDVIGDLRTKLCADLNEADGALENVRIARSRIRNLAKTISSQQEGRSRRLLNELVRLSRASDAEIYRDLLDPNHDAMPIEAFLAMADAAELKPIGDLDPIKSNPDLLPPDHRPKNATSLPTSDVFKLIDQQTHTRRRHVLLVHAKRRQMAFDMGRALGSLCLTSDLARTDKSLSARDLLRSGPIAFGGALQYRTENPIEIVTLTLMESHRYFPVRADRLTSHVVNALKKAEVFPADRGAVSRSLLSVCRKLIPAGALVTHLKENRALPMVSDQPIVTPLVLYQARQGATYVTSLLPHSVKVDATARFILSRLDGTQTVQQISEELERAVSKGELTLAAKDGTPAARAHATTMGVLGHAARSGLLVS